jgi:hypothetical protein
VANAIAGLPIEKAVFDGEVVVEDRQGIADFAALQDALKVGRNETIAFYVFDLLHLNGHDVKPLPLLPVSIANARSSAALPRRGQSARQRLAIAIIAHFEAAPPFASEIRRA